MQTKLIALMGTLALAACGDAASFDETQPYDEGEESTNPAITDDVASTEQALGEAACASTFVPAAGNANGRTRAAAAGDNVQVSPNAAYNASGCPLQYVVEYTGIGGIIPLYSYTAGAAALNGSTATFGPLSSVNNKVDCERTRLSFGVYVWNTAVALPVLRTFEGRGKWISIGIVPPFCSTNKTGGSLPGPTYQFSGQHKVRIAARVEYCRPGDGCIAPLNTDLRVETKLVRKPLVVFPLPGPLPALPAK